MIKKIILIEFLKMSDEGGGEYWRSVRFAGICSTINLLYI